VVVLAAAFLKVGRLARARVREFISVSVPQVRAAIASLRRSQKLAQLILGSVATEVLFAIALGMFARALGYPLSIADLLVINMSVSLFSSFIPVPGGIGIVEGGLAVGLTAAGVAESAAFATALLYRIATFYLPPIWGWFALRWLRHHHYL
jgi:glycosyltransferase 2 family protein